MATKKRAQLDPGPSEELEANRMALELAASRAASALVTLNRQIRPKFDEEARKALRIIDAVLRMFSRKELGPMEKQLLERLYRGLAGGDLGDDDRTLLAAELAELYMADFRRATTDEDHINIAHRLVTALALRTDEGWASLLDNLQGVVEVLSKRRRSGGTRLVAALSRGIAVLGLPRRAAFPDVLETVKKRVSRAKG